MVVRCHVESCNNRYKVTTKIETPRIYYYSLAVIRRKNPDMFDEFLKTIGYVGNQKRLQHQHICSIHFAADAYNACDMARIASFHSSFNTYRLYRGPRLRDDAWPTLNLAKNHTSGVKMVQSTVLDRNEVQHCVSRNPVQCDLKEEALVPNTAVKQEPQEDCTSDDFVPFEHINVENIPSHGDMEGAEKMDDGTQSLPQIKLEPMEDIPSQHLDLEYVESAFPSQCLDSECVENGIPSQHLDLEHAESGIPSHYLDPEHAEPGIPSQCLDSECMKDGIPLTNTEFLDVLTVLKTESNIPFQNGSLGASKTDPLLNNIQHSLVFGGNEVSGNPFLKPELLKQRKATFTVTSVDKLIKKPNILNSKKVSITKTTTNQNNIIPHIKQNTAPMKNNQPTNRVCMCIICYKNEGKEIKMQNVDKLNEHLDSHIDTTFKQCFHCGKKCISINDFYSHVKTCKSDDIDFTDYVDRPVNSSSDWWSNSCKHTGCSLKFPNYCSKLIHEKYSTHVDYTYDVNLYNRKNSILLATNKLQCLICKVKFEDEKLFHAHCMSTMLFPESLNYCTLCKNGYETNDYTDHMKVHKIKCKMCVKNHQNVNSMIRHNTQNHNLRMVHCLGCCKTTSALTKFRNWHVDNCITKFADNLCALCGQSCDSLSELNAHLNVEELDLLHPQYQCRNCFNYFCSKLNLACHMLDLSCQ